jgi:hypothetical protein
MTLEKIKEIKDMKDFKNINAGQKFLMNIKGRKDPLIYIGQKTEYLDEEKKLIGQIGISEHLIEDEKIFEEVNIYLPNFVHTKLIRKGNSLYNLYNRFFNGGIFN